MRSVIESEQIHLFFPSDIYLAFSADIGLIPTRCIRSVPSPIINHDELIHEFKLLYWKKHELRCIGDDIRHSPSGNRLNVGREEKINSDAIL